MAETYVVTKSAVALAAATAKTVASVISASGQTARIFGFDVTFDGTNSTAVPTLVELVRFTTDGTGTAFTPIKGNGEAQNKAALCAAKHTYTVEPTTPTVIRSYYIAPVAGIPYQFALGREQAYLASGLIGVRITAPAAVNTAINLDFEE